MLKKTLNNILAIPLAAFALNAQAYDGFNGEFVVGFGPITLGHATMSSDCKESACSYETRAKGSFMWIKADMKERGSYIRSDHQVMPLSTSYNEKVGSKKRDYTYDFSLMEIKNGKTNEKVELPENSLPFIPLLYQVTLDLKNGGPKEHYDYLSKHRTRRATVSEYKKTQIEQGTLHYFIAKRKDKPLECFFLQKGDQVWLEKLKYGSFKLQRKDGILPNNIK